MNITLNGLVNPKNIITLSGCPTILTISNTGTGNKASAYINVNNLSSVSLGTDYYIEVNGERIFSTTDISKSLGRNFYITNQSNVSNQNIVASKIISALKNVNLLDVNYNIYQYYSDGALNNSVQIHAKEIGSKFNLTISTNLPSGVLTISTTNGSNSDTLASGNINKILIDIYKKSGTSQDRINSENTALGEYVTTLEKTYYRDSLSFDLSPFLTTIVNYSETTQFNIVVYSIVDTALTTLGAVMNNYVSNGYLVNQGGTFLPKFTSAILAQNVKRGETKSVMNNTILYTYEPSITFSLFTDITVNNIPIVIQYKDSSYENIATDSTTIYPTNNLQDFTINLNQYNFTQSDYVDFIIPEVGTLRYKIIKPLNAVTENYRVYYNNSYGGVSFFDFTGDRTEKRKTSVDYYQEQLFDYYQESKSELNKIYNKTVDITITLKTHNMEKDGTWQLYDLQNSTNAWTVINGKTYTINITDMTIDETTVPNIYTATMTYTYSLADSF